MRLRGLGHAVDTAATSAEAEDAWAVSDYACVILDLGLPDGSGLDLLRARRRARDRTPVIIATALDQISDRIAGLDEIVPPLTTPLGPVEAASAAQVSARCSMPALVAP